MWMRSSLFVDEIYSLVLEQLPAHAKVATFLYTIPASSDTVESEGRQMTLCRIQYKEKKYIKNPFHLVRCSIVNSGTWQLVSFRYQDLIWSYVL